MSFYKNAHRLHDGNVLVYQRPGAKKKTFHARIKITDVAGYVIKSLKTTVLETAIQTADDLYLGLRFAKKQGLDVKVGGNMKFKELWKRFYSTHETGLSIHRQRLHKFFAEKYFNPFFGDYRVGDLPDMMAEKYWDWRINYYNPARRKALGNDEIIPPNAARIPSQKTLQMEAGMLRQIFRWGKRMGYVKREPWVKPPKVKHDKGVDRRPSFSGDEWKAVYKYLRTWVDEKNEITDGKNGGKLHRSGPHSLHRFQRAMLRNYVLFMANSGLRPNEARQLLWRDIRFDKDGNGKLIVVVEVSPNTKTGARTVVCRDGTETYVNRLKELSAHNAPDDHVFCGYDGKPVDTFNRTFAKVLDHLGLLKDRWGKKRSIYSLRHFYCTQTLISDNAPIHIVANNMGTSLSYIQKHYSHVTTLNKATELSSKQKRVSKQI